MTLVRIREEHLFTFISSTRCLKAEFFKLDLRLNAQQTPESVMAGLNNSEQFLWRPWGKGFIQGILKPPMGSPPRKKPFLLGLSQNGGTPLQTLTLTLFFRPAKVTQIGVQGSTPLPKLSLICHFFNNQKVAQARPFRSGLCHMTAAGRGDLGPQKVFFWEGIPKI